MKLSQAVKQYYDKKQDLNCTECILISGSKYLDLDLNIMLVDGEVLEDMVN